MFKIIKHLLIFFIASFVLVGTAAFLILNTPFVQSYLITYLDKHYFNDDELEVKVDAISYNLFSRKLTVRNLEITDLSHPDVKHPFLIAPYMTFKINFLDSYMNETLALDRADILDAQILMDYDVDGHLIIPAIFIVPEIPPITIPEPFTALTEYMKYIPKEINILNSNVKFGLKENRSYQTIGIEKLNVQKYKNIVNNTSWLSITSTLKDSLLSFPALKSPINLGTLNAQGNLYQNGRLEFTRMRGESDILNFDSTFLALLQSPIRFSNYEFNLRNSTISSEKFFGLFGIPSTGQLQGIGKLTANALNIAPTFSGSAQWQDLTLHDFNLFSGETSLQFKNQTFYYDNAALNVPSNGKISAYGKFEFFDTFYFENYGNGKDVALKTLLSGVKAAQDAIDGDLQIEQFVITGHLNQTITNAQHDKMNVIVNASIHTSHLHLIQMRNQKSRSLPNLLVNLNMRITDNNITFDGSSLRMINDSSASSIEIENSRLFIKPNATNMYMAITGKNIDLEFLEYFVAKKSSGELNFNGILTYDSTGPGVQFRSQIHAKNGSIDYIQFASADGNFALYKDYGEISNLTISTIEKARPEVKTVSQKESKTQHPGSSLDSPVLRKHITDTSTHTEPSVTNTGSENNPDTTLPPQPTTSIDLIYFSFRYNDLYSNIVLDINGSLGTLLLTLKNHIPKIFNEFDGDIKALNFTMTGYLMHTNTWKFTFNTQITNLDTPRGTLSNFSADLQCIANECTQSKILFNGFITEKLTKKSQASSAFIFLYDVSFKKAKLAFQLQNVPIRFFNYSHLDINGNIYANGELDNIWTNPKGIANLNIDHFELERRDFGQIAATFNSNESNANVTINGFDNAVQLSVSIPDTTSQMGTMTLALVNFDIARILSTQSTLNKNLYSRINAFLTAEGEWKPSFKTGFAFLKTWSGSGEISDSDFQIYQAYLNLQTPEKIFFKDGLFTINKLIVGSEFATLLLHGKYNITNANIFLQAKLNANLDRLNRSFIIISDSNGTVDGDLQVTGSLKHPSFSGQLTIEAPKITLVADTPSFTDVSGFISFKDKTIAIQKLSARKGAGDINLTGAFDFTNIEEHDFAYPLTNLHLVTRNASFQLPIPIFRFVNLEISSDLTLSGQKLPFLLAGETEIHKMSIFRDLACDEIFAEVKNLPKTDPDVGTPLAKLNINVRAFNSISLQSSCLRGRFSTSDNMTIVGTSSKPLLDGSIITENAVLAILKAHFNFRVGEFAFSEAQKYNPVLNIDMNARIASYDIYWKASGRLSNAHLDLSAQPEYLPDGSPLTTPGIFFMIATGQIPTQDSVNTMLATSSGVYSYFGANNTPGNVVNQTLSTVTGGLFDTLSVHPGSQNGEMSIRIVASRYFSDRLTFGGSFEEGPSFSTSIAFINYLINRHVGFTGAFSSSNVSSQTGSTINELTGGLRFNFGSY